MCRVQTLATCYKQMSDAKTIKAVKMLCRTKAVVLPAMVPRNLSNETFATFPMTGDVTTATVIAAHFQLCSHAFAISGGKSAAQQPGHSEHPWHSASKYTQNQALPSDRDYRVWIRACLQAVICGVQKHIMPEPTVVMVDNCIANGYSSRHAKALAHCLTGTLSWRARHLHVESHGARSFLLVHRKPRPTVPDLISTSCSVRALNKDFFLFFDLKQKQALLYTCHGGLLRRPAVCQTFVLFHRQNFSDTANHGYIPPAGCGKQPLCTQ